MDENKSISVALRMTNLLFEELSFKRHGSIFIEDKNITYRFSVGISDAVNGANKVVLETVAESEHMFECSVKISAIFEVDKEFEHMKQDFLKENAVAILMPYVRSQLTLLTAQPNMKPIVMPPINIVELMKNAKKQGTTD